MNDKCRAAVLASLIGDALALGVHWEYDPEHILKTHGRINTYLEPDFGSYHSGKKAGNFTHYGDQTMVLLESVVQKQGFELADFARRWQELFTSYSGYMDKATRQTLSNFEQGADPATSGSNSTDLAGAVRMAPLFCVLHDSPDELMEAIRAQTAMTHNHPAVLASAKFLGLTMLEVLAGTEPLEAMQKAAKAEYGSAPIAQWLQMGLDTLEKNTATAITRLGASCNSMNAMPGVVHLIAKYPDDLSTCLVECVMAGGDSAARAMATGMVLGAHLGPEAIPDIWLEALMAREPILAALDSL